MATQQRTVDYLLEQSAGAGPVSASTQLKTVLGAGFDRLVAAGDLVERSGLLTRP